MKPPALVSRLDRYSRTVAVLFLRIMPILFMHFCGVNAAWAQSPGRWGDERVVGPFICHADFHLEPFVSFLEDVARIQTDLTEQLRLPPGGEPIHLYLFARQKSYEAYIRRYFPEVPMRRALYIRPVAGPGMVFAYYTPDFLVDLRHESTHALLHNTLPVVPLWLDEGLAEYYEMPPERRRADNPYLKTVRWNAYLRSVPDLRKLEELSAIDDMGEKEYRSAWAWVHFMLHGDPAAKEQLIAYLDDLRNYRPGSPLSRRLQEVVSDPQARFGEHFRSFKR